MRKSKIIIILLCSVIVILVWLVMAIVFIKNSDSAKKKKKFNESFQVELTGKIVNVVEHAYARRVIHLDVVESSHKYYKSIPNEAIEFLRLDGKEAKILMGVDYNDVDMAWQYLKKGNIMLINTDQSKKIYILEDNDTVYVEGIGQYGYGADW